MIQITATPSSRLVHFGGSFSPAQICLSLTHEIVERVVSSGGTSSVVVSDRNVTRTTGTTKVQDCVLTATTCGGGSDPVTWSSSNPAVGTVDDNGYVTHITDGSTTITASFYDKVAARTITLGSSTGSTQDTFNSFVNGSLAKHVTDAVDTRIAGKSFTNALTIFSSQDHINGVYVRNPNAWCSDIDLTCMSPWNSSGGSTRAGTLISPRHIAFAWHFQISVGATIRFVKMDGTVVERTMVAKQSLPNASLSKDVTIGLLDSDVPEGISFAKILPASWATKLPSLATSTIYPHPVLTTDYEEKALVVDWKYVGDPLLIFSIPADAKRLEFYEPRVGGDSGNPAFLLINNQPVLICMWTYGGAGASSSIMTQHKTEINAVMASLGGGYSLTEVDLSGFNTY